MILLTPGPTPTSEDIRLAMGAPTIHHRTKEMEDIFASTRELYLELVDMKEVVFFASSGSGAMDCAVSTFCQSKALVVNAGKFGERFTKIATHYDLAHKEMRYAWNESVSAEDIVTAIKNDTAIDSVFIQMCESAGGVRHPVEEIAQKVKHLNKDITIVIDGITAIGVEKIDTSCIDVLIGGSQKAFMLPPGLSMLSLSEHAVNKMKDIPSKSFYFDLNKELKTQQKNTTAYTPASSLIIGLEATLQKMKQIGYGEIYKQTSILALATRSSLGAIGLEIFPKSPALAMTTITHPRAGEIIKLAKAKYQVHFAGGQDHLSGNIFRINHMGIAIVSELAFALSAVELILEELGIRAFDGRAGCVFYEQAKECF